MPVPDPVSRGAGIRPLPSALLRTYTFGLDVVSDVAFDVPAPSPRDESSVGVRIEGVGARRIAADWPALDAVVLRERRDHTGRRLLTISVHAARGYRIHAPDYGDHVVAGDGRHVLSAVPSERLWGCKRLLFAQVLPLASLLQGFELFHASAVAVEGGAFGFVAGSGTGKSSVAAHLVSRGARFVTDDVLALEAREDAVYAHPGPGLMALFAEELERVPVKARPRLGTVLAEEDKVLLGVSPAARAVPLRALYFLARDEGSRPLTLTEVREGARALLSSAFITYLTTPERMTNHLRICARLRGDVPLFRVRVPGNVSAGRVATMLQRHMERLARGDGRVLEPRPLSVC